MQEAGDFLRRLHLKIKGAGIKKETWSQHRGQLSYL